MQSDRQIAICNAHICKSNENQKKTCRYLANKIAQPWQRCGNKWMMCAICLYIFSSVLSHLHCSNEYQSKIVMSNVSKMRDFQREKWYFCLLQTQFNMKKWKPWKINSSWRDCLFSFLFEFLPHCVWLKMIMKCKLFEILTRHLFQKKRETLCIYSESHFVNEQKTLTGFKWNAIIFHHHTIWIGCSLLFRNEFLFYRIFA